MNAETRERDPDAEPRQHLRHFKLLAEQGELELLVRGRSMVPILQPGDRIRIAKRRLLLPGDLIAFENADGRILVHRVLGPRPSSGRWAWLTRADATGQVDLPVPGDKVIGCVVAVRDMETAARVGLSTRFSSLAGYAARVGRAVLRRLPGLPAE